MASWALTGLPICLTCVTMLLRQLHATDAADYFRLRVLSDREFPEYVGMSAERELIAGEARIAELLAGYDKEGIVVFGAFADTTLVGVACISRKLSPKYHHKVFVWGMYVAHEFRRQNVGKRLVTHIIEWARNTGGVTAVQLQVTTTNARARTLYEQFGFVVYGTESASLFAAGKYHDVYLMELAIKANA